MEKPDAKVVVGSVVGLGLLGGIINLLYTRKKEKARHQHILNTVRKLMMELEGIGLDNFEERREA